MSHATRPVDIGGHVVEIDIGIAHLIEQLRDAGIATTNSCEENKQGYAWIHFATTSDAQKFLSIVANHAGIPETYDPDNLYCRIMESHPWSESPEPGGWYINHVINDAADEYDPEADCWGNKSGIVDVLFSTSVRFPREQIDIITQLLLKETNE